MNETELKPCPFCGGKASVKAINKKDVGFTIWCECDKCGAKAGWSCPNIEKEDDFSEIIRDSKGNAIKKWNSRV